MFDISEANFAALYDQEREWIDFSNACCRAHHSVSTMAITTRSKTPNQAYFRSENHDRRSRPPLMLAAYSLASLTFTLEKCDILLTMHSNLNRTNHQIEDIKAHARTAGREVEVYTIVHIICRGTDEKAQKYYDYYADEMADTVAVTNFAHNMSALVPMVAEILMKNRKTVAGAREHPDH
jgi:alkanesulfonate monooxygenase SsuD/methylene tetrahydromethanopterin reductase-like flavin-dependent oxidoreductase (luciferase family)